VEKKQSSASTSPPEPGETASLGTIHWVAVGLTVLTGVLHLYAGVIEGAPPVLLAGVGLLAAVVLFVLDYRRRLLYGVGIVFTGVQIPLWYVIKMGNYTTVGYVDKAVQVVLVVVLIALFRRASS
jgi:hypothetical protein